MAPPSDVVPRHIQINDSAHNSSNSSPIGTPPNGTSSQPRTPNGSQIALPSPPIAGAPLTPTSSQSSNRFGLALNFIQRRPRGLTNPGSNRPPSSPGGGRSPANSPGSEMPPSPSGGGERTGYGFPALRRQLSKRAQSGETSRTRSARSNSQPPAPSLGELAADRRPGSAGGLELPQPPFAALSHSTSLPSGGGSPSTSEAEPASATTSGETHRIRLVPHLESSRSLHFEPVDRDMTPFNILRVGRFTDRSHSNGTADPHRIAFKSKVVSRGHAEIWCDDSGKYHIKDTKSSSGTFLNHIRLSGPNSESRPFPLKDGDVLQLGVDYQGGTEEIYRCVKMRVELNRGWQRGMNTFNTNALAQLRALGGGSQMEVSTTSATAMSSVPTQKAQAPTTSVTDCCICLYPVTVCQALFIAPCSHVTHFKCIRPLVQQNYPGFCCPLCRTYADLEADVEIEPWEPVPEPVPTQPETVEEEPEEEALDAEDEADRPSRAPSVKQPLVESRRSSLAIAGADGVFVPLPITDHHRSTATASTSDGAPTTHSVPLASGPQPIAIGSSRVPDSVYTSLSDAATPPNSTFLSTLADSGTRYIAPVSIDMAMNNMQAGGSSNPDAIKRDSFGSEEETDGAKDDDSEEAASLPSAGKGKGKLVERDSVQLTATKVLAESPVAGNAALSMDV